MAKAKSSEKAVKPNIFMRIGLFIKQIICCFTQLLSNLRQSFF